MPSGCGRTRCSAIFKLSSAHLTTGSGGCTASTAPRRVGRRGGVVRPPPASMHALGSNGREGEGRAPPGSPRFLRVRQGVGMCVQMGGVGHETGQALQGLGFMPRFDPVPFPPRTGRGQIFRAGHGGRAGGAVWVLPAVPPAPPARRRQLLCRRRGRGAQGRLAHRRGPLQRRHLALSAPVPPGNRHGLAARLVQPERAELGLPHLQLGGNGRRGVHLVATPPRPSVAVLPGAFSHPWSGSGTRAVHDGCLGVGFKQGGVLGK